MTATEAIWSAALSRIASSVRPEQFETWFKSISLADATPERAVVRVPNAFYGKWFEVHYVDLIAESLGQVLGARPTVAFEVEPRKPAPPVVSQPPAPRPAARPEWNRGLKLRQDYVFSRFITGPSNQLAHAAALAVVESPGLAYNPLFLHGSVGLGKTHLMQAVAHALLKRRPEMHIRYLSCEGFMNQFLYALQQGGLAQFRARCRQADILMIDDIHVLARRQRTQEEFFHTFNELYNQHRQIILSCDAPPDDIPTFEERLISRFKWGMVARIDSPCLETRMVIVRKKAELRGRTLPDDVVEFIAEIVPDNVRELEGAVLKTIGYASLMNRSADLALAREILRPREAVAPKGVIACERIGEVVGGWFGVRPGELQGKSRARSIAFPRQVCMYLARELTNRSLEEVGRAFGGRDHSTVAHACERVRRALQDDPQLQATVHSLIRQIQGS